MDKIYAYMATGVVGFALGILFFYGLWRTVSRFRATPYSITIALISFLGRTALALGGLWWIAQGDAGRAGVGLLGFVGARMLVFRLTRVPPSEGSRHAS